ncbi:MAG: HlyD family efflux transporter periplasmic adaptor subunit [Candidatus Gastranaerophilales bacterium]|nr:HlyD family efflux transporter periplasmic adaptor subunit [Candidatus Gastranaerophilales bacterium]
MFKKLFAFKNEDYNEFKPVLSEIEEEPLNPLGPFIFWIIIFFFITAAGWMYFAKTDVIITTRGIIIPDGEEKIVQSLNKGVLSKLNIKEGQYVRKDDVLAVIQPAEYEPAFELKNLEQDEISTKEELLSAATRLKIVRKDLKRLRSVLDIIEKSKYNETLKEEIALKHQINGLNAALAQIQNRRRQIEKQKQILKSPANGYIGQIFIHTEGAVVNPAEKIATVVPDGVKLKIKAKVLNRDIGFVKKGADVSIKLDAYEFQKFGTLKGKVDVISPNSIEDKDFGPVYEIYITPHCEYIQLKNGKERIRAGLSTTNEINIGKRRVIEFFIYPAIKYFDESIKLR